MYLTFFNLTYFKYLYQDTKDFSFNEVWLSKHFFFFYKKYFTFSKMQTLKTVKSIHSIVTRLLRYSHKDISFNEVWLSKHLFLVFFYKKMFYFQQNANLENCKKIDFEQSIYQHRHTQNYFNIKWKERE